MIVGVTGARGMLGWHVAAFLSGVNGILVRHAGREIFESAQSLVDFVTGCDAVIHCAGMNRGDEQKVALTNVRLVKELIQALETASSTTHVIFTSSTHVERNTLYGESKRECAALLKLWADTNGAGFTNLILPNVFGEHGKPFYNSVVSTFCYQIANESNPSVHQDAEIEQIHAQNVARIVLQCLKERSFGEKKIKGHPIRVTELLEKIKCFGSDYDQNIIPDVRNDFDRDLFNTFRSYFYPSRYPASLTLHSDARGSLFESVKTRNGGQTFLSSTKPGITRGNHFHTRKIERFLVIQGKAEIRSRRVLFGETQVFSVSGALPAYIDIPTLYTHNIKNVGSTELITLFWTHEFFDPHHPDTFPEVV
jgi:UDP-2-acetamido-2,6-beta-L-arabino-hexul-4-ose reductase